MGHCDIIFVHFHDARTAPNTKLTSFNFRIIIVAVATMCLMEDETQYQNKLSYRLVFFCRCRINRKLSHSTEKEKEKNQIDWFQLVHIFVKFDNSNAKRNKKYFEFWWQSQTEMEERKKPQRKPRFMNDAAFGLFS